MPAVDIKAGAAGGDGGDPAADAAAKAAKEAEEKKNREDNKKKKCDKKLSEKEKEDLRKSTPSTANRAQVQRQTKCYACLEGKDGSGLIRGHPMEADHIVPFKEIIAKPGFACLSKDNQLKVVNEPGNIVGLCKNCNASKGARTWNEWKGHKKIPFGSSGAGRSAQVAGQNLGSRRDAMINNAISGMPWNT